MGRKLSRKTNVLRILTKPFPTKISYPLFVISMILIYYVNDVIIRTLCYERGIVDEGLITNLQFYSALPIMWLSWYFIDSITYRILINHLMGQVKEIRKEMDARE